VSWEELLAPGVTARPSPLETQRFGCTVARVTIGPGEVDGADLVAALDARDEQVLIVRYDAARLPLGGVLAGCARAVVPAGALTYWQAALPLPVADRAPDAALTVTPADRLHPESREATTAVIREVVRDSFRGYGNHYTANPLLDDDAALDGYEEWALRTLADDPAEVLVLSHGDTPVGVATLETAADHVEILLAGLTTASQGQGWYGTLLAACAEVALQRGLARLVISTQVHNIRVQRAWARAGLRPFAAIETVHLVAPGLLSVPDAPPAG